MGNESAGQLTQFRNSKVAMMFLVADCITTDIRNVTTRPK
jgi:hypothetical protein